MKQPPVSAYRATTGSPAGLCGRPTSVEPLYRSGAEYREQLAGQVAELDRLQQVHYADNRYALLLIFQAMDAAGKDSVIRHVMTGVNPQGCQVHSFGPPSAAELEHDFLWRTTLALPERGRIGIFNRSYYEEVLVVRVHPELLGNRGVDGGGAGRESFWQARYHSITTHEEHLWKNGTRIVKFYLHLSPDEQRRRFIRRIETPSKQWKFSMADIEERSHWQAYMEAYEACITATSTEHAPWYIVPADDKRNARLIVAAIIADQLGSLDLSFPSITRRKHEELEACRKRLHKEGES